MKLMLVRHATAVPRGTPGVPDDERPLTSDGKAEFRVAARGLARIAHPPDVLLTSPLPRARVTAEIVARAFGRIEPTIEPALVSGSVDAIVVALKTHGIAETVAVVGHEPALSVLIARLLGVSEHDGLTFEKGGAALVDLPDGPSAGGRLIWFLEPRILRILASRAGPSPLRKGQTEEPRDTVSQGGIPMDRTAGVQRNVHGRQPATQVLARVATTGIYLVRGVPRDLQRAARARAVSERTTLRWVLLQALHDYAAGTWTPRRDDKSSEVV